MKLSWGFIEKTRTFIVEEKDVTTVLSLIGLEAGVYRYVIENLKQENDSDNGWLIEFTCTERKYGAVVKSLTEIGTITLDVRPDEGVVCHFKKK